MAIKITRDSAKLLPGRVSVTREGKDFSLEEQRIIPKLLVANTPRGRVERLKRHKEAMLGEIEYLELELNKTNGNMDWHLRERIRQAEIYAFYLDAAPRLERDNKRQEGARKKRKERWPEVTKWIKKRIVSGKTAKELWANAPEDWKDPERRKKTISFHTFEKYVSAIKNGRK